MKALIKFEANWCDEFDCEQFVIVDEQIAEEYINEIIDEDYHGFGTNQDFEPGDITRDSFAIFLLSDDDADMLKVIFPTGRFGLGIL